MMHESLINSPLLAGLAITLIHFLWQGVLVAVVLKALLSLISYQKSQLRYALSSIAMLTNLALPILTFFIVYDTDYRQGTNFVNVLPLIEQSFYLENIPANAWYMEWMEYLSAISITWITIVVALALKLLIELYNVNKLPLQSCTPADIALQQRFNALITKVGLTRNVALLISGKTQVPMAIGWLKPVVLIPFSMLSGLTPQQLDMLLLHELAHIRRHDYLVNFLQTLVELLLFFHPAVRWVSKQMRNEREYCSDDIAVKHSGCSLAYAHTLADTASLCATHRQHSIPSMAMAASGGDLKQRVVRLIDGQQHCTKASDSGKWLASFTVLVVMIFLLSKQSITLPVIDLQSGSISLHNTVPELNKNINPQSNTQESRSSIDSKDSHTSLANQLLAINSPVKNKTTAASAISDKTQQTTVKNSATDIQTSAANKTTQHSATSPNYNELPIVRFGNKNNSTKPGSVAFKNDIQHIKKANISKPKTISQLAFERTDSQHNKLKANSYSEQLSTLLNEPKTQGLNRKLALSKTNNQLSKLTRDPSNANLSNTRFNQGFNQNQLNDSFKEHKQLKSRPVAAQLINSVDPKYPSAAKRRGIELEIMVEFSIDKNGYVKDIQFESKSKVSYFRSTIRNAMEKWRFLPAKKNGRTVESEMSKIFSFSLLK